jgi:hypothetical protein
MGLFHFGLPPWLLDWAVDQGVVVAVESGTFMGDSADLLGQRFGRCITIERDPALASAAAKRFTDRPDVEVRHGSSRSELADILAGLDGPVFFWLDAHWSGGVTAGADDPCPLIAELDAIASSPNPERHIVAVDDMRIFGFGFELDPRMEHHPRLSEILNRLERLGLSTFVLDDVIVGVPPTLAGSFLQLDGDIRQRVPLFMHWSWITGVSSGGRRSLRQRLSGLLGSS